MEGTYGSNTGCAGGENNTISEHEISPEPKIILAGVMSLIFLLAFISNLMLLCIVMRNAKLWTAPNKLVLNLSVCSLLTVVLNGPFVVSTLVAGRWIFPCWMCDMNGFMTSVYGFAAITTLAVISINRYQLVRLPNRARKSWITARRLPFVISGIWIFSCLLAAPPLFGWSQYEYVPHRAICTLLWSTNTSYTIFIFLLGVILPFIVILYSYLKIFLTVRTSFRNLKSHRNDAKTNVISNDLISHHAGRCPSENNASSRPVRTATERNLSGTIRSILPQKSSNRIRPKYDVPAIAGNSTNDAISGYLEIGTTSERYTPAFSRDTGNLNEGNNMSPQLTAGESKISGNTESKQPSSQRRMLLMQLQHPSLAKLSSLDVPEEFIPENKSYNDATKSHSAQRSLGENRTERWDNPRTWRKGKKKRNQSSIANVDDLIGTANNSWNSRRSSSEVAPENQNRRNEAVIGGSVTVGTLERGLAWDDPLGRKSRRAGAQTALKVNKCQVSYIEESPGNESTKANGHLRDNVNKLKIDGADMCYLERNITTPNDNPNIEIGSDGTKQQNDIAEKVEGRTLGRSSVSKNDEGDQQETELGEDIDSNIEQWQQKASGNNTSKDSTSRDSPDLRKFSDEGKSGSSRRSTTKDSDAANDKCMSKKKASRISPEMQKKFLAYKSNVREKSSAKKSHEIEQRKTNTKTRRRKRERRKARRKRSMSPISSENDAEGIANGKVPFRGGKENAVARTSTNRIVINKVRPQVRGRGFLPIIESRFIEGNQCRYNRSGSLELGVALFATKTLPNSILRSDIAGALHSDPGWNNPKRRESRRIEVPVTRIDEIWPPIHIERSIGTTNNSSVAERNSEDNENSIMAASRSTGESRCNIVGNITASDDKPNIDIGGAVSSQQSDMLMSTAERNERDNPVKDRGVVIGRNSISKADEMYTRDRELEEEITSRIGDRQQDACDKNTGGRYPLDRTSSAGDKSGSSRRSVTRSSDANSESNLIARAYKEPNSRSGEYGSRNAMSRFCSDSQKTFFSRASAKSSIRGVTTSNMKDELRITAILFIILTSFMMCWAPITVVNFIETISPGDVSDVMNTFSVFMMFLSSLVNPLTYGLLNRNFRRELSALRCSLRKVCRNS